MFSRAPSQMFDRSLNRPIGRLTFIFSKIFFIFLLNFYKMDLRLFYFHVTKYTSAVFTCTEIFDQVAG